ncbi:serine hydrolase domain-containing protein [Luteimonas saliphila]|uniref:serine hydrolase domain-containing protein n=1 Tax=Luteimonas saliphila TaxID=2804919 RepID=UPI00192D73F3|nr:serine hydrolase [Luteimonas saliphila]
MALVAPASISFAGDQVPPAPAHWPTTHWEMSSPEAQGMSSADLADGLQFALAKNLNVHSVTVVRNGVIVLDAYFHPYAPEVRHDVASVTKSVVSMLVGLATDRGLLQGPEQSLVSSLPTDVTAGATDVAKTIRLGDLLSMRSGFDCGFKRGEPELRAMRGTEDWAAHALRLPTLAQPGTRFGYCSPNFHLLSAAISSGTRMSALDFARQHLFGPLGITDVHWPADARGISHGWGDLQLRPTDMAKLGLLMLNEGRWADHHVLSEAWVETSVAHHFRANEDNDYGLGWWMPHRLPGLFEAVGRGGQRISISPGNNMVVVTTGGGFEPFDIGQYILKSVRSNAPLPPDPANQSRLDEALRRIAAAPAHRSPASATVPGRLSGRVYELEENALGLRSFAVEFKARGANALTLGLANGDTLVQPLGLDGRYRITTVEGGAISAGRAEWFEDGRLRIELNRLSRINRFVLDVVFRDRDLELVVWEPTEFGTLRVRGTARKQR